MKKLAFLLLMVVAFVTTSMAQVDTNKMYRLKDNATSQYLTAHNYDEHAGGAYGGVGTSALAEDNEAQIFIFEQSGSNYKIKTKTGYYIYAQQWNVDALSSKSSEFKFTANGTAGYYMQVYNTNNGNAWCYVKNENVSDAGGYYIFGDAAVGAAATWTFEEVAVDVPSRTITVSANNDAWGTVSGGGIAEGAITITATPADGCKFVEWQLNGIQISTQQNYIDETEGDKEYVAIFAELEPYELICKPTFNKAGNTTFVSAATILADGETSTIDVAELAVLGQQGFVNVGETYAGATFDLNLTYTLNWGDLSLYQIAGDEATSIYGPFEGSWVDGGSTSTVLTNIVNAGLTVEGTTVTYPITISSESQIGDLVVIRAITGATSACETGITEGGYIDFVFTVATPPCTVTATSSNVAMGTVTPEESKINSGNNITLTATPNEGYEFVNWTVAGEEVSTDATYTFTVTQDIEVVANFQIIPGTQTFNITVSSANETMGSVEASTLEVVDGNTVILTATANDGYRFVNWTVAGEEVSTENPYTATITAETAFVANFVKVYNVTATADNGNVTISGQNAEGTFDENSTATLTATPNNGYLFTNWTLNGSVVGNATTLEVTVTADAQYVANFEKTYCTYSGNSTNAGRYLNSFTLTDGTNQVAVSNIQTAQSAVYVDKTTSVLTTNPGATLSFSELNWTGLWMHGYVFIDYNNDKEFNGTDNNNGTTGGELVTYSAYTSSDGNTFKDINGNLTPDSDGSGSNDSQEGDGGNGVSVSSIPSWTLPADLEPGNYRLRFNIVWNTKDACGYADMATNGGAMVDITLRIELPLAPTYAVTAVANDATMGSVTSAMTEQDVYTMEATANEGYEFVNWTVAGSEVSAENPYTATITSETEFVANFQVKEYNVIYKVDGEEYQTVPTAYGSTITPIAEPEKEGYTFSGWSEVPATMPANDVEVTGTFTVNSYTITYKVDGEEYATETYDFGADVTAIAEPEKEGYTFSGWSEIPATMPANDVEVTGTFTVNSYTITYKVDGEEYATETYDFGATVTPVAAPVKVGYTFSGWSEIPATMPANDVEVTGTFTATIKPSLDVTTDNKEEVADAAYSTVTIANDKVWDVQVNTILADKVSVSVDADGVASEVKIADGGQITTVLEITRTIEKGKWALMSLPFAVDLANVTVDGVAAVNNSNIKVMVYDAAYRAANSIELFTKSGWKELTGTTIAANQGFAVAINANNGDEQKVTFTATSQTYDGTDKQISLSRYASTVNEGADADWNFYGNPTLAKAQKGTGYALYVYNAEDDSYDEYASSDVATYQPYAAWFVQSADDFNAMIFSAGVAGALAEADGVFGELQFSLNGDDEARIVLVDESSEEYVRNEDALYFPAINTNLSQLYLVKGNIKMAVSEQPSLTSMAMGYKAVKSGEQTLTLTSVPENTSVVLVDNVAGTETAMTLGDTYTFQSEAGTFNNRFVIETTDLTGISQAVADGEVKVLVSGTEINVYGAEAGTEVVAYTTNGTVVASAVAEEGVTTLSISATGVIVVKVANTAVKVIK